MMEFLERFERALETKNMNGQLRMLNFTCAEKVPKQLCKPHMIDNMMLISLFRLDEER